MYCWERAKPWKVRRIPYTCNSWRCKVCRKHEAHVAYARIREAVGTVGDSDWSFGVGTLDRNGVAGGREWLDTKEAYREMGRLARRLLVLLGREYGAFTRVRRSKRARIERVTGNQWVGTVEKHANGFPHYNLMLRCPALAAELRAQRAQRLEDPEIADAVALLEDAQRNREPVPSHVRDLARKATLVGGRLGEIFREAGFGHQSTLEVARGADSVSSYMVKVAGNHERTVGELAKVSQLPTNAPGRFRRLRSGKGFLPPRRKNPNVTGCLVRRRASREGDQEVYACNGSADPDQQVPIAMALHAEQLIMREEETIRSRNRGKLPAMPPVRFITDGVLESHRQTSERLAALAARELAACA